MDEIVDTVIVMSTISFAGVVVVVVVPRSLLLVLGKMFR